MLCLLIETKDNRKLLTHKENFPKISGFLENWDAKACLVKVISNDKVLSIEELAEKICDPNFSSNFNYNVTNNRQRSVDVKNYVIKKFESGDIVSLRDLKEKFKKYNLTDASFCNHVRRAKEILNERGIKILKVKAGVYKADV